MKPKLQQALLLAAALLAVSLFSNCKTMKGFGRDVQHVGNKIETKADEHTHY